MAKLKYLDGFDCRSQLLSDGLFTYPVGASVNIAKGDALSISSGYIALATSLDATFVGIAAYAVDNSSGSNGDLDVQVIPPLRQYRFRAPVEAADLITLAQVGLIYDLESEDGIDEADASVSANGFFVDAIDVTSDATDINTYGYAIGHFVSIT